MPRHGACCGQLPWVSVFGVVPPAVIQSRIVSLGRLRGLE